MAMKFNINMATRQPTKGGELKCMVFVGSAAAAVGGTPSPPRPGHCLLLGQWTVWKWIVRKWSVRRSCPNAARATQGGIKLAQLQASGVQLTQAPRQDGFRQTLPQVSNRG